MKKMYSSLFAGASLFAILSGATGVATAALGEIALKTTALPARQLASSTVAGSLEVRSTRLPSGTEVREYLDAGGKVVAIAWQGPTLPDLQQLLGSYFPRFVQAQAVKATDGSHRQTQWRATDVVVESHGHLRAFQGRAYLPAQLPAGFSAEQIQ